MRSIPRPDTQEHRGNRTIRRGHLEAVYFTLVAVGLYFFSDWLLDRIERQRGKRFEQRSIVFFAIIAVLAIISFQVIQMLMRSAN